MDDSLAHQIAYRKNVYERYRASWKTHYSSSGERIHPEAGENNIMARGVLWGCQPFLEGDTEDQALANALLSRLNLYNCTFSPAAAVQLLLRYRDQLTEDNVSGLENYLLQSVPFLTEADKNFRGHNDNHPAMVLCALALIGEYFDDKDLIREAERRIRRIEEIRTRKGFPSEYNSPTYTPLSITSFAMLANDTSLARLRELAIRCEQWFWKDVALHYHAPSQTQAGPHARAYWNDFEGGLSFTGTLLSMVYGKGTIVDSADAVFAPQKHLTADFLLNQERQYLQRQNFTVYLVQSLYHPSPETEALLFEKSFPVTITGTYEQGQIISPVFPCRHGDITTYMTEDAALGTADTGFLTGSQSDSFFLNYRRARTIRSFADTQTVYTRYVLNEAWPIPTYAHQQTRNPEEKRLNDEGMNLTVQDQGTALVAYRPMAVHHKPGEMKVADQTDLIKSLRLCIFFPLMAGREVDRIFIGGKPLQTKTGHSDGTEWITVHDGPVCYGFYPLLRPAPHDTEGRIVSIRRFGSYMAIELYNYKNQAGRVFTSDELAACSNGFIFELGPEGYAEDPSAFHQYLSSARISDQTLQEMRTIRYSREDLELATCYSVGTMTNQYRTINGRCVNPDNLSVISG